MPEKNVKVALVQHPPVFLNLQKTLAKVETIAEESAKSGAKIIVFPEKNTSARHRRTLFASRCFRAARQ